MGKLSKRQAIKKHRTMWNKVAEVISEHRSYNSIVGYKEEALKRLGWTEDYPLHQCYCCEYDDQQLAKPRLHPRQRCQNCPVVWRDGVCAHYDSEYGELKLRLERVNPDWEKAYGVALQIANLPVDHHYPRWVRKLMRKLGGK